MKKFKSLLSMALILMMVFSFPAGVFAETAEAEPASAQESEIIETAKEEANEEYLLTEQAEVTEEPVSEEAEETAELPEETAQEEAVTKEILPESADAAEDAPAEEISGMAASEEIVLAEAAAIEAGKEPEAKKEETAADTEAVSPTDGSAYAVLTDNYDLIFFRSKNTYANGVETTAVDIYGNTYKGKIYDVSGFEYQSDGYLGSNPTCPAKGIVRRIRVADNQQITIGLTNGTLAGWGYVGGSLAYTFSNCPELVSFNGKGFVTDKVVDMHGMFLGCTKLKELDLSTWNVANVKNIGDNTDGMFERCSSLEKIDLSIFKNAKLEHIDYLFDRCTSLKNVNFNVINITNCSTMDWVFNECTSLKTLDLSGLNTQNIKSMKYTFYDCSSLETLNLSGLNTKYLENMGSIFAYCTSLKALDLSSFSTGSILYMGSMFDHCDSLRTVKLGTLWYKWEENGKLPGRTWGNFDKKIYKTNTELCTEYVNNMSAWAGTWVRLFNDVAESGEFYFNPVYWAVDRGITTGYTDKNGKLTWDFGPNDSCTRGQVVTFLYRAAGSPAVNTANAPKFKDVKKSDYFYKAVIWAAQNGITSGYTDKNGKPTGKFGPNDPCTRGQVVTFLYRAAGSPSVSASGAPKFSDVKKSDYFYNAVIWAAKKGITTGISKTKFAPDATCTRGMVVTFLYRSK